MDGNLRMTPESPSAAASAVTVAIRRAPDYLPDPVGLAVASAVSVYGGWERLIRRGDRVLVKPNCISATPPERCAQTHPVVILAVCRQLLDYGAKPYLGDSPAWGSLMGALHKLGIVDELARLGVPVVPFNRPVHVNNPRGKVFTHLTVDAAALEADAIVNLPKFKAHRQLLMTLAIKNMFGCVGGRRKAWWHVKAGGYENYFGRMLVETFEMLRPVITILDAVVAMQGKGPISGTPKPLGLLLAGTDGPALEIVAAEIVGVKPQQLRTLRAARELQIGNPYLENIHIDGPQIDVVRCSDFELPHLLQIGFSLPRVVKGAFKNAWITHQQTKQRSPQDPAAASS